MADRAENEEEVFADATGVDAGKADSRDSKRTRRDCESGSEADKEKMKVEILDEMRQIMRDEMLDKMREEMRVMINEAMKDVMREAVREETLPVIEMIKNVEKKVCSVEEQMRKQTEEVKTVKEEVTVVKKEVNEVKDEIATWKDRVENLEDMVIDQQARSRRNNGMFYGVPEMGGRENCERMVRELIVDKCGVTETVRLERVHRVPPGEREAGSKPRPIVCKFLDYKDKETVKKNAKNLPAGVKMADDLPKEIRAARKILVPDLERAKAAGKDAFIAFPSRLIVNKVCVKTIRPGSVVQNSRQRTHVNA